MIAHTNGHYILKRLHLETEKISEYEIQRNLFENIEDVQMVICDDDCRMHFMNKDVKMELNFNTKE